MKKLIQIFLFVLIFTSPSFALVRITNMNDFSFGTWSGSGQLQSSDSICIVETAAAASRNYGITPRGSGAGFAFTVASGANTIAYTVEWQGSVGAMTAMTSNVKTVFTSGSATTAPPCGGATNATMRITFSQANLEAATNGSYSGVLTIIVSAS